MKLIEPKFWNDRTFTSYLLYPLTLITRLFIFFKKNKKKKLSIKTICVGNLYVGGTGKTPLSIEIYNLLKKKYKTIIIKKNYSDHKDEINLLKKKSKIIFHKKREKALLSAEKNNYEIAIFDDGLQQKNIHYDLKIVCFNSKNGFGNKFLIPAGPLREDIGEIKNHDVIFLNGEKTNKKIYNEIKSINKKVKIYKSKYYPQNLKKLDRKKKYLVFSGIGNPKEFENTLLKFNFKIREKIIYPDHYNYTNKDIQTIKSLARKNNLAIITTEKDYLRLNNIQKKNISFLEVKLKINKKIEFKKFLIAKLCKK